MKRICFISAALFLLLSNLTMALPDNTLFSAVLKDYVHKGRVQYSALKKDKRLAEYIKQIKATSIQEIPKNEIIPFWVNVYNAYTLFICCEHYPIKSINDITALKSGNKDVTVWDYTFVELKDKKYSLNEIENTILRPLGVPEIHFALVCAAKSCVPLRSEAYTADRLDNQLKEQATNFLNDRTKNSFDASKKLCSISKIFEWYGKDFGGNTVQILHYISNFLHQPYNTELKNKAKDWSIIYSEYDWSLNE